jgi:hypothetical protein
MRGLLLYQRRSAEAFRYRARRARTALAAIFDKEANELAHGVEVRLIENKAAILANVDQAGV